jgi:predicted site-specific integrase-resolvase
MTATEAIRELHISRTTLRRWIAAGYIQPCNPPRNPRLARPGKLVFRRADVERLKAQP